MRGRRCPRLSLLVARIYNVPRERPVEQVLTSYWYSLQAIKDDGLILLHSLHTMPAQE